MARKKEPSINDALSIFREIMNRASLSNYLYINRNMVTVSPKGYTVLIIPDKDLWMKIMDTEELKKDMKEIDLLDPNQRNLQSFVNYGNDINNLSWIDINCDELFQGKLIKITINDKFDYDIQINKDLLPVKLKKAEFRDIKYRVFLDHDRPGNVELGIMKRFNYELDDMGFVMIRILKVV